MFVGMRCIQSDALDAKDTYLDQPITEKLAHEYVTWRLDQCNSLLYGLPDEEIMKLQRVQNTAVSSIHTPHRGRDIARCGEI